MKNILSTMSKYQSVAVTGGAGFLGSHMCAESIKRGHKVICIDNFSTGTRNNIEPLMSNKNFKLCPCDIRNFDQLKEILVQEKTELVYHYAAVVGVKRTLEEPEEVLDVNIRGTVNVLQAALQAGCTKVVNVSSSEVYGSPVEVPEREDSPKNVELPYAISKLTAEIYAQIYYQKHGLKTTSMRLFNVYGPRQDSTPYGFVVGIFIKRLLNGEPPIIYGDGFQTRDFTYIEDSILPTIIAAENDDANGEVFNIAAGKPVTILDLAESVIELCGKKLEPIFEPERDFEIRHRFADISKMRTILGYKPEYDLKEGLKLTIESYKRDLGT